MAKVIIESFKEFEEYVGKEIGVSEYIQVTQEQINQFADATLDHQWIHLDQERAKTESPFKTTVAHGFLTLSLVPHLWHQIAEIRNIKMLVNYGIEKFRFGAPVLSGDEVRLRVNLKNISDLRGISKTEMDIKMEIKDNPKAAFTGTLVFLYHFK
ncbi:MaoC family dehydratase [Marinigracilibium pacificum]|uniref:MaoC family dehydratase n=1 Tax=Marinigracilibium pacificum TaxID=2729599 RepID=A0A848IZ42_9BACT|nr:MaoC family dehydratase [Marinigracilibium pacificum]NMM47269.1 MaoC family dehydratase [Marinigracilibium pacificum]